MVYFVKSSSGVVKIGYTASAASFLQNRFSHLKRDARALGFSDDLEIIGYLSSGSREDEKTLHASLAAHRVAGEWFRACDEVESAAQTASLQSLNAAKGTLARQARQRK